MLDAVAATVEPLTVRQIAQATGLDRTVAHRQARTLAQLGFLEEGDGAYRLGPRLLLLGNAYLDRLAIRRAVLPFAVDLQIRAVAGHPWVVGVAVPVGADAVLIDRIWTPETPLDSILDVGTRLPIDRSANGRAMLAYYDDDEVVALVGAERAAELAPVLADIRASGGIALSSNERRPGISAIAAVVRGRSGRPVGAIAISGPELEEHLSTTSVLAEHLSRTAASIGMML